MGCDNLLNKSQLDLSLKDANAAIPGLLNDLAGQLVTQISSKIEASEHHVVEVLDGELLQLSAAITSAIQTSSLATIAAVEVVEGTFVSALGAQTAAQAAALAAILTAIAGLYARGGTDSQAITDTYNQIHALQNNFNQTNNSLQTQINQLEQKINQSYELIQNTNNLAIRNSTEIANITHNLNQNIIFQTNNSFTINNTINLMYESISSISNSLNVINEGNQNNYTITLSSLNNLVVNLTQTKEEITNLTTISNNILEECDPCKLCPKTIKILQVTITKEPAKDRSIIKNSLVVPDTLYYAGYVSFTYNDIPSGEEIPIRRLRNNFIFPEFADGYKLYPVNYAELSASVLTMEVTV